MIRYRKIYQVYRIYQAGLSLLQYSINSSIPGTDSSAVREPTAVRGAK